MTTLKPMKGAGSAVGFALSALVQVFGVACVLIGLAHILLGPRVIIGTMPFNATMDSEDRFFGTMFAGFGAAHLWCALKIYNRRRFLAALQVTFFAGGLARILSCLEEGLPGHFYIFLRAVELILPLILLAMLYRVCRGSVGTWNKTGVTRL